MEACEANEVDVEAVRTMADVSGPDQAIGDMTPDAEFGDQMRDMLGKLAR